LASIEWYGPNCIREKVDLRFSGIATDPSPLASPKSVSRQIDHARQYAERKGWIVDEASVFVDDGISGAEFANRLGFLRLMNALKPRAPFQVLVMSEESRLGQEAIETAYALKQLVTGRAESTLRETAPPEVTIVRSWLNDTIQRARGNFQLRDILPPPIAFDPKPGKVRSNAVSGTALIAACVAGIKRCDELLIAPLTRAEIRAALAEIRASIPPLASMTFTFELESGKAPLCQRVGKVERARTRS
jgi:hypothetical protein